MGGGLASGINADGWQDTQADDSHTLRFASRVVGSIGGDLGASYVVDAGDEFDRDQVDDEEVRNQVIANPAQEQTDVGGCNSAGPSARAEECRSMYDGTVEV